MRVKLMKEQAMANEVIILVKEIIENAVLLEGNFFQSIESSDDGSTLLLKDKNNNFLEYSLSEVSSIFSDEIQGLWEIEEIMKNIIL